MRSPGPSTTFKVWPRARGIRRRQRKDVGAVLHVGHRYAGQRADDQVVPPELLAQGGQIAMIPSPDEAGPKHGEVPAVLLGKTPGHPLLPPFGDGVAVASVDIRRLMQRRVLVQDASGRSRSHRPRSCCTAPAVGSRWLPWRPRAARCRPRFPRIARPRRRRPPPPGGAATSTPSKARPSSREVRRSALKISTEEGQPSPSRRAAGRTMARTSMPRASSAADHVPAEEPIRAGDKGPHSRCSLGLRASIIRLTSRTWVAVTGRADPSASAAYVRARSSHSPS